MKVGTDGVLLGCFVHEPAAGHILDIGSGTGLIALMMAQKFPDARVDAVEIEEQAAAEATENFTASAWASRLQLYHDSIQRFAETCTARYDLLLCNPPFFKATNTAKGNNPQRPSEQRALARFSDYLPFPDLIQAALKLMQREAAFYIVLPIQEAEVFKTLCRQQGLFLNREMLVTGRQGAAPNRSLMRWSFKAENLQASALDMYHADTSPTENYIAFTRDFYLWKKYDQQDFLKW